MRFIKFIPIVLISLLLIACGSEDSVEKKNKKIDPNMNEKVSEFNFINQDEEEISNKDLEGKYWIADFVFTNCESTCIPMTHNMSTLQDMAKEKNLDIQFISFSLDPDRDTPKVLKKYGKDFGADFDNWDFLTGYEFDDIRKISINSFKSMAQMPADNSNDQVIHGTSFYLIDPNGKVIKSYPGTKKDEMNEILKDIKKIQ